MSNKKVWLWRIFFLMSAFLIIRLIGPLFGIIANSDTQPGIFPDEAFRLYFHQWRAAHNGGEFVALPRLSGVLDFLIYKFLGIAPTNILIVALLFLMIIFLIKKLVFFVIKPRKCQSSDFAAICIAIFGISNDYVRGFIIYNTSLLFAYFYYLASVYFFLKFLHKKTIIHFFWLVTFLTLSCVDFHTTLLTIMFMSTYVLFDILYEIFVRRHNIKLEIPKISNFLKILLVFLFINSYWFFSLAYDFLGGDSFYQQYSVTNKNVNEMVVESISRYTTPIYSLVFSNIHNFNLDKEKIWLSVFNGLSSLLFVYLIMISVSFLKKEKRYITKKRVTVMFGTYLIFLTFILGPSNPLGIFNFFWKNVPGFTLFRDFSKFNRLLISSGLILSFYSASKILKRSSKNRLLKKTLILLFLVASLIKGSYFLTQFKYYKPFKYPKYYFDYNRYISNIKLDVHVQPMPIISWMQKYNWSNQNYDVQDPFFHFVGKPLYLNNVTYVDSLIENINKKTVIALANKDKKTLFNLLAIRNIREIIIRNDLEAGYITNRPDDFLDVKKILSGADELLLKKNQFGELSLYEVGPEFFVPHFYLPKEIITLSKSENSIFDFISRDDFSIRSSLLFTNQNLGKNLSLLTGENRQFETQNTIEFKKINPSKYRVIIHNASGLTPLIFSESYHQGWRISLENYNYRKVHDLSSEGYQPYEKNSDFQASNEEISSYLKEELITIPQKEKQNKLEFISKKFQDTIQNDNLRSSKWHETIFSGKEYLSNKNHFLVNGFSNLWLIEAEKICSQNNFCQKNEDGTYNIEILVEFWPQNFCNLGYLVAIIFSFTCLIYLFFKFIKRKICPV